MFMEMDFYTEVIKTLILWLNGALVESKTSERWKQMVCLLFTIYIIRLSIRYLMANNFD